MPANITSDEFREHFRMLHAEVKELKEALQKSDVQTQLNTQSINQMKWAVGVAFAGLVTLLGGILLLEFSSLIEAKGAVYQNQNQGVQSAPARRNP